MAKQFGEEEKTLLICIGIDIFESPKAAKPVTPLARPLRKPVRAQEKMKLLIKVREPCVLGKAKESIRAVLRPSTFL
jgi:hypothetical protein